MKIPGRGNKKMVAAVAFSFLALAVSLGSVLHRGSELRSTIHDNCTQIELLKKKLRPDPFNYKKTARILREIGIDPTSEVGRHLIAESRTKRTKDRAELAPEEC